MVLSEGSYEYEIISRSLDFATLKPAIFTKKIGGPIAIEVVYVVFEELVLSVGFE